MFGGLFKDEETRINCWAVDISHSQNKYYKLKIKQKVYT
jgi:hypothetical protein